MSMHPQPIPAIPEETARVAHAILPRGNVWLQMRDEFGTLYEDHDFQDLFPRRGQPAEAPWCLALVTLMQYAEGLTDRQAAEAVRTRIDWKYVLSLELTDPGFDFSVLSEFRGRLLAHGAERRLFDQLLNLCRERGWIKARGKQRTDSTHVLAAIRTLRRLECVGETMRHALNILAEVAPAWLLEHMGPAWAERCSSNWCTPRRSFPGYENWMLSKRYGRYGSSTIMPTRRTHRGAQIPNCRPQPCSLLLPMMSKLATAARKALPGRDTKSILPRPVKLILHI